MREFRTPQSREETAKILASNFKALDPELAQLFDGSTEGVATMPNRKLPIYWQVNLIIGALLMARLAKPNTSPDDSYESFNEDEAWGNIWGH